MLQGDVKDWMTSPVITVSPETNLTEARRIIEEKHIRTLPVMQGNKLVGMVTRQGLLRLDLSILGNEVWNLGMDLADETVADVMTGNLITITPDSTIPNAARIMLENKINALPVMENDRLIGILTSSDLLRFILLECPSAQKKLLVSDYMTDEVITIEKETSLLEAHHLMSTKRIRSLPVVENGRMIGLVTRTDLMGTDPTRLAVKNTQEASLRILAHPVEKVIVSPVLTISANAELSDAARIMLEKKIHCLPVVDENKEMVGIITESDLFLMVVQKYS